MKKLISIFIILTMLSTTAFAWEGAEEYDLRKNLAQSNELNVYTESDRDSAPYFGAKLEPRSGVYFGTLTENNDEIKNFPTLLSYMEFDSRQPNLYVPSYRMVTANKNMNVMLAWNVANAETIRNIDSYTDYIENIVKKLSEYGNNFYIRFAGEMNDAEIGTGDEYIRAFRKVADIVHRYDNMAMVWSPIALGSLVKPFKDYYPGDEYVDWIGISSYQIKYLWKEKDVANDNKMAFMTDQYAWQTNSMKPMVKFMNDNNIQKPIMISEGGVANRNTFGEDTSSWAAKRLRNMYWDVIMEYPQVKMINYFNTQIPGEVELFNFVGNSSLINIVNEATHSGAYITLNGENTFSFKKIQDTSTITGPQIPLYSHAHSTGEENIAVEYYVDGKNIGHSDVSPNKVFLNLNTLTDGNHTLEARSIGNGGQLNSKSYPFTKLGVFARFGAGKIVETKQINVSLDGNQIEFDVPPCIIADRTLVPLRAFANALGINDSNIDYNDADKTVTLRNGSDTIKLYINNLDAYVNNTETELDVPPTIIDGRTLVPLRFISENFSCNVNHSDTNNVLNISLTRK